MITVQLAFAPKAETQLLTTVQVSDNGTVQDALDKTDWLQRFPDISGYAVGIFAKKVDWQTPLTAGDRIEIYRPLCIDPMKKRQAKMQIARRQK